MKSLNAKLVLSALGIALLATPAFAARKPSYQNMQSPTAAYNSQTDVGTYPNGAIRSGSEYSRESGAEDNVIR